MTQRPETETPRCAFSHGRRRTAEAEPEGLLLAVGDVDAVAVTLGELLAVTDVVGDSLAVVDAEAVCIAKERAIGGGM